MISRAVISILCPSSVRRRGRKVRKTVLIIGLTCFYILALNQLLLCFKTFIKTKPGLTSPKSIDVRKKREENGANSCDNFQILEVCPFPLDGECFWETRNQNRGFKSKELDIKTELKEEEDEEEKRKKSEEEFTFLKTEDGRNYKKILFYYHSEPDCFRYGSGYKIFENSCCLEKRCFLSEDTTKIPLREFDALLIQHVNFNIQMLPKERYIHQRYIFTEMEAPDSLVKGLSDYKGIFNWTMTYRKDSDIQTRYGYTFPINILPISDSSKVKLKSRYNSSSLAKLVKEKTKMAVWLVSHCSTISRREAYVEKLQKFIDVDIYGKCGTFTCPANNTEECYETFEKNYKFYLSFENSICNEYISEKLFNLLRFNIIPVVFGGGDYSSVAPPHSFINVRSFRSIKALADYLKFLDTNDDAYQQYFKWKENYFVSDGPLARKISLCNLCQKLHEDSPQKVYHDLRHWYYDKADCISNPKI